MRALDCTEYEKWNHWTIDQSEWSVASWSGCSGHADDSDLSTDVLRLLHSCVRPRLQQWLPWHHASRVQRPQRMQVERFLHNQMIINIRGSNGAGKSSIVRKI